jgi:hypothetical protein
MFRNMLHSFGCIHFRCYKAEFKKCAKIRPYLTWSGYWLPGYEEKKDKIRFSSPNPYTNPGTGRVSSFPEVPSGAVGGRPQCDGVANSGPPCRCPSRRTRSIPSPSPPLLPQIQYVSPRLQSTLQFLVATFLFVYIVQGPTGCVGSGFCKIGTVNLLRGAWGFAIVGFRRGFMH